MPTYEYECLSCHERVEAVQKFADPALTKCENCGGSLRKVISAVGIVFKGSGFYKNDSRKSSSTRSAAPAASPTPSTPSTPSTSPAAPATASASSGSGSTATGSEG